MHVTIRVNIDGGVRVWNPNSSSVAVADGIRIPMFSIKL